LVQECDARDDDSSDAAGLKKLKLISNNISLVINLSAIMRKLFITILTGLTFYLGYGQAQLKPDYDRAVKLLKAENYQEAEKIFSDVLNKATDDKLKKFCFIYRAFSYNGLGLFKRAIADLDSAIKLDASDLASYADRGKAKGYANDLDGAKQDFLYILTKDSTGEQGQAAFYYLAKIAYQQKEFDQSINYSDRYILLVPDDAEGYFNRGSAKDMIMDPAGSIRDYDKAIQLDPEYTEAYANRGVAKINLLSRKGSIQLTKEQTADACADLKRAKQLGDNTVDDMIFIHCDKK
jgi:tetratricopeptide (TPR) repeat protein